MEQTLKEHYLLTNYNEIHIKNIPKLRDILDTHEWLYKHKEEQNLQTNSQQLEQHAHIRNSSPTTRQRQQQHLRKQVATSQLENVSKNINFQVKVFNSLMHNINKKEKNISRYLKST